MFLVVIALLMCTCCQAQITLLAPCNQSALQSAASGSWLFYPDLGHVGFCQGLSGSQYCAAYTFLRCVEANGKEETMVASRMFTTRGGPVLGLCVPSPDQCSTQELSRQAYNTTRYDAVFQALMGPGSLLSGDLPSRCTNASYAYLTVDCLADERTIDGDGAAIAVTAVLSTLAFLALLRPLYSILKHLLLMTFPPSHPAAPPTGKAAPLLAGNLQQHSDHPSPTIRSPAVGVLESENMPLMVPTTVVGLAVEVPTSCSPPSTVTSDSNSHGITTKLQKCLSWFDMFENVEGFLAVQTRGTPVIHTQFFEGMRVVAMVMIINVHWAYYPMHNGGANDRSMFDFTHRYTSMSMYSAMAVDVFFFLSGFLQLHIYFRETMKAHGIKGGEPLRALPLRCVLKNYVRRYLRLTPTMMVLLVTAVWLVPYVPTGPRRAMYANEREISSCHEDWWRLLLYVNNLNDGDGWRDCLDWLWYLACDMQLYIAAPLFLLPYFIPRYGEKIWIGLAGAAIAATTIACIFYRPIIGRTEIQTFYDKPYLRCAPYLYGMLTCVLVRRPDVRQWLSNPRVRLVLYTLSLAAFVSSVNVFFLGFQKIMTNTPNIDSFLAFANPYCMSTFGLSLALVSLPWCCGYGGLLCRFFSHPVFAVLSKLVYSSYLVHPIVFLVVAASEWEYFFFSPLLQLYQIGGTTVVTVISALALYLLVEVPSSRINDACTK